MKTRVFLVLLFLLPLRPLISIFVTKNDFLLRLLTYCVLYRIILCHSATNEEQDFSSVPFFELFGFNFFKTGFLVSDLLNYSIYVLINQHYLSTICRRRK